MNTRPILVSAFACAALLSGCVGVGPNTQQGAVAGGALGVLAGAVIGHNSRGADALGGALLGGTVGALAGGTVGNSIDHQRGTLYGPPGYGYASRRELSAVPPPPPPPPNAAEVFPAAPTPNALWIPGAWSFDGRAYAWSAGHWEVPPPNVRTYVTAHWERRGGRYFWVQSYWQ